MNNRRKRGSKFWTRERVTMALQRYYRDFGILPTDQGQYARHQQHTGKDPLGNPSNLGWHQKYPSAGTIFRFFSTMREAWEAAGFDVNHTNLEWKEIEDWFIVESCGLMARDEVAAILKRSTASVKRRLYDLGRITCKTRWGISVNGAAHKLGVAEHIVHKYVQRGVIPSFHGYKTIYLNPADLFCIKEVDWNNIDPNFGELVRKCLIQRAAKIIKYGPAWRDHEIYKFKEAKPAKLPRKGLLNIKPAPEPPNKLKVGNWVKVAKDTDIGRAGRVGFVRAVHYSPLASNRKDGTKRKCWVARIEFPKRVDGNSRVTYTLPLDCLVKTTEPKIQAKPLSMNPEAVRGRNRKDIAPRKKRIQNRLRQLELT